MKFQNNIKRSQVIWKLSEYNQIRRWIAIYKLTENQQKILKLNRYTSKYEGECGYVKNTEDDWLSLAKAGVRCLPELK